MQNDFLQEKRLFSFDYNNKNPIELNIGDESFAIAIEMKENISEQ